jgi:hypothetical protein
MKASQLIVAGVLGIFFVCGTPAHAQGNGNGHGNGHGNGNGHNKHHDDGGDCDDCYYKHHEKDIHGWYAQSESHLPPGLAKKDQLPPGLEKQLVRNGTLPPGLQKKLYPCPEELQRRLPPPPPDCGQFLVGGHIVLLNRRTNIVVDIFHFEM